MIRRSGYLTRRRRSKLREQIFFINFLFLGGASWHSRSKYGAVITVSKVKGLVWYSVDSPEDLQKPIPIMMDELSLKMIQAMALFILMEKLSIKEISTVM
jgi:hypothetical protein